MEKSYVGTGFYICPICGNKHGEVVLLNQKLRNTLTQDMYMGLSICKPDQELFDKGYIALIGVKNQGDNSTLQFKDADRTGEIVHIKKTVWSAIFKDVPEPTEKDYFFFVDQGVIEQLKKLQTEADNSSDPV